MDVKRTIYDLCPDKRDTYLVVIEVCFKRYFTSIGYEGHSENNETDFIAQDW